MLQMKSYLYLERMQFGFGNGVSLGDNGNDVDLRIRGSEN